MDTQPPQPGQSGSNWSCLPGTSSNLALIGKQHERRHQSVHRDAGTAATKNLTPDADLKMVLKTGHSTNKKLHAVGSNYIHAVVKGRQ